MSILGLIFKAPTLDDLILSAKTYDPSRDWGRLPPFLYAVPIIETPLLFLWIRYPNVRIPFHPWLIVGTPIVFYLAEGFQKSALGKVSHMFGGASLLGRSWDLLIHPSKFKEMARQNVTDCEEEYRKKGKKPSKAGLWGCGMKKQLRYLFGMD